VEHVVVGAGAIGGTVGARLVRDRHDVLYLGRIVEQAPTAEVELDGTA
jgi:ketopantoate reductase